MKYLIQFELNPGEWHTVATRRDLTSAKAAARKLRRDMKVYETGILRDGDPPVLRRTTCEGFELT